MSYSESSVPDQSGKIVFVTGANTGIGFEAARVLAAKGARVLLGCRSEDKARAAIEKIKAETPVAELRWIPLDLTSLAAVDAAAAEARAEPRLDVLINNAGVMIPPKTLTEDGFELQFGVNHLGHFALTGLLFAKLSSNPGARVVNVSSLAHVQGEIDFEDPHAEHSYDPMERYRASKLANMLFTFEMARRCEAQGVDITNVACHPGIANTELSRYFPKWFWLLAPFIGPFFNSAAEGALPTVMAATADVKQRDYFGPVKRGETARSADHARIAEQVSDEEMARQLWVLSEEATGTKFL